MTMDLRIHKKERLERLRAEVDLEYSTHKSYHMDIIDYFAPRRGRFTITQANRGRRRGNRVVNEHAFDAVSVMKAGMMAGITNPSVNWVRLTVEDRALAETGPVKAWLDLVTKDMNAIFLKSNLYRTLPTIYGDLGTVASAAMLMEADDDDVVRFYSLPIGSYKISANAKGKVDVVVRDFRMTIRQLIEKFSFEEGEPLVEENIKWDNFSLKIREMWDKKNREAWVDVVHIVSPNPMYDPNKFESKFKRYSSDYYERGMPGDTKHRSQESRGRFLSEKGNDLFPIPVPRWETTGEDAWGTNSPAMKALGTQRALQKAEIRLAQADELGINPPMNYPAHLKKKGGSSLPGAKNYIEGSEEGSAIRPSMQIDFDKASMLTRIERYERSIDNMFHKKAFVAISDLEGTFTAFEINARLQEGRLQVAGALVNIQDDLLEPAVDFTFARMLEDGRIPEPPEELQGLDLKVEFIGVLAQAQKSISLGGLQTFYNDVGQVAVQAQDPTVWDKVDTEQLIDELAEAGGVTPSIVVSDEEVFEIKQQRIAEAQAQAQAEQAATLAGAAKNLSETDLSGDSALTAVGENL